MNENTESDETSGVDFLLNFWPEIAKHPDLGDAVGYNGWAPSPLFATIRIDENLIATDDLDQLVTATELEVSALLSNLAEYIKSDEYVCTLSHHLLTCIATYRGTVLRKGIHNREHNSQTL